MTTRKRLAEPFPTICAHTSSIGDDGCCKHFTLLMIPLLEGGDCFLLRGGFMPGSDPLTTLQRKPELCSAENGKVA